MTAPDQPSDRPHDPATPPAHLAYPTWPTPAEPKRPNRRIGVVVAAVAAAAVIGGGTYALAQGTDDTGSSSSAQGPGGNRGQGMPGGGQFAPPSGTVVSATATTVTVKLSTGTTKTYTLASGGVVERNGATSSLSALQAGDKIVVLAGRPGASATTSTTAERILAGTSATSGFGRDRSGQGGQGGGPPNGGQGGPPA